MIHPPLKGLGKVHRKIKKVLTAMEVFYIKTTLEKRTQIDIVLLKKRYSPIKSQIFKRS